MNYRIIMALQIRGGSGSYASVSKELDSAMIPVPGMYVQDSAWKKPQEPTMITCDFGEGYYHLQFQYCEYDYAFAVFGRLITLTQCPQTFV